MQMKTMKEERTLNLNLPLALTLAFALNLLLTLRLVPVLLEMVLVDNLPVYRYITLNICTLNFRNVAP